VSPSIRARCLAQVLIALALAGLGLAVCLIRFLPALAAIPAAELGPPPLWCWLVPAVATLSAVLLVLWRDETIRRGGNAERIADLPGQVVTVFTATALAAGGLGVLLERHPLHELRHAVVLIGAPALVLAAGLFLRLVVQPPLVREMAWLLGGARKLVRPPDHRRWGFGGVLAIRRALALITVTLTGVSVALVSTHSYSRAQREHELLAARHLRDVLEVTRVELELLPEAAVLPFFAGLPASTLASPVLMDAAGHVLVAAPGVSVGEQLLWAEGDCTFGARRFPCLVARARGYLLASLRTDQTVQERALGDLRVDLILLALLVMAFAGLLGWAVGRDTSRDFQAINQQLEAMARQDELDLGQPIPVTSIDEVGELTAALGKLRLHLERELAGYRESLRKTSEADRIKNRFFSDVSHELRIPLTTICGYAQLLAEGILGELPTSQREDLRVVHGSAQHLLQLINDVIDISIIESGHLTLHLESVDLAAICHEVVRGQSAVARRRSEDQGSQVVLQFESEPELPHIIGDPTRLRQVVQNLVSNALKFTREGSVALRARKGGEATVVIEVRDTGVGISATDLPHVFERYRQVGAPRQQREGSGLGLGICKHLVQLHGGEIVVVSEVSRGSVFTVRLPVQGPDPAAVTRSEVAA